MLSIFDDLGYWTKRTIALVTGRSLFNFALAFAVPMLGAGNFVVAAAITGFGLLYSSFFIYRDYKYHEGRLTDQYRDEIAAYLGLDPLKVDGNHLNLMAYGDDRKGIQSNPVLKEALEYYSKWNMLKLLMMGATSVAVLGLVGYTGLGQMISNVFTETVGAVGADKLVRNMQIAGIATATGTVGFVLNYAFENALYQGLGFNHPTANDLIRSIRRDVHRGVEVSEERIFGVFVAANKVLASHIEREFEGRYEELPPKTQKIALEMFAQELPIRQTTKDVNGRFIQPDELAFIAIGQASGVKKLDKPAPRQKDVIEEYIDKVRDNFAHIRDDFSHAYHEHRKDAVLADEPDTTRPRFAERYASRTQQNVAFADRVLEERKQANLVIPDKMTIH